MANASPKKSAMPNAAQQALIDAATHALSADPRIDSVWLSGSLASGEGDDWSDVDLVAVAAQEALPQVVVAYGADLSAIARTVNIHTVFGRVVSAVRDDWERFDILFLTPTELKARPAASLTPLFTRDGVEKPEGETPPPRPASAAEIEGVVREFLRILGLLPVALGRRDHVIAVDGAMLLRTMLVDLMLAENGRGRSERSVKRVPQMLNAEQTGLIEALPSLAANRNSLLAFNRAIAGVFLPRAKALAKRDGVAWPEAFEAATRAHLKRTLDLEI